MKALAFVHQEVTNFETGAVSKRLAVRFDNSTTLKLYIGDESIEDKIKEIKGDRDTALKHVQVRTDGPYKDYCVLSSAKDIEEF